MLPRMPAPPVDIPTLLFQLGVGSFVWYAAAVGFPFLLWGARKLDADRLGRVRVVAYALGGVALGVALTAAVQYFALYGIMGGPNALSYIPMALRQTLVPWVALAGIVGAVEARRRSVQSRLERESLRAQVAEQRLVALTGQLHPHFLFNTLQGISTLIHRDPKAADEMLGKLSDLLREVLRHRDHVLVPLADEVRYARTLLEIARIRFADRLSIDVDVPNDLLAASVPLFILQPLIENALAHGIGRQARGGSVRLLAARNDGTLILRVEDDGAGPPSAAPREGIGLSNTRERLRASFGDEQRLTLEPRAGGGAVARIEVPYRTHPSRASQ
jgi:two-component system, LytTR family, sensor kinase